MPTVDDAVIKKHWFVAAFTPPNEDIESPLGALGAVATELFADIEDAKTRAKTLAAQSPGAYFVVYEAMWYAFTNITPVTLRRVGMAITA